MASVPKTLITPEEYLAIERAAERKSEYFAGEMFAMAGATEPHNLIITNAVSELRFQFKGRPCYAYSNDMRVKVSATGLYTYPDVVAVCGERRFEDERRDTLLNPTVIVEVLSESAEAYDRGDKFALYRRLESLQEYVLVSQDCHRVERFVRGEDGQQWVFSEVSDLTGTLRLDSIGCSLPLSEIYDKVELAATSGSRPG
jgi:Uma2 family endonuclease